MRAATRDAVQSVSLEDEDASESHDDGVALLSERRNGEAECADARERGASAVKTVKLSGTQNFVKLASMLQLDLTQIEELDLCLQSGQNGSKD